MSSVSLRHILLTLSMLTAPLAGLCQDSVHYEGNPLLTILTDSTARADRYDMSIFESAPGEFNFLRVTGSEHHFDYSQRSLLGRRQTIASVSFLGIGIDVASLGLDNFAPTVGGRVGICLLYHYHDLSFDRRLFRARLTWGDDGRWVMTTAGGTEFDEIVIEPNVSGGGDSSGIAGLRLRRRGSAVTDLDVSAMERCP